MLRSFFLAKEWALWAWGGLILLCGGIGLEVWVQVFLNDWYRRTWDFLQNPHALLKDAVSAADTDWNAPLAALDGEQYGGSEETLSALAQGELATFWGLLGDFCIIVFPFIIIRVFSSFFAAHYAFRWRQAITFSYLPLWEKTEQDIEGASQRLQEDPQKFAAIVQRLGLDMFRSVLTLLAFAPILWNVSKEVSARYAEAVAVHDAPFALPFFSWTANTIGSLMWVAIGLALGGTIISYFVGIKLPGLEYNNQKVEAKFRKQLVYGEDDKQFARRETIMELFTGLRFNYFRLYLHSSYFALWANIFAQFVIIADLILLGEGIVLGIITLGFLQQVMHAFGKVTDSMKYFVDNWTTITELMSVVKRLREFERNIGYAGAPLPAAAADALPVQKIE